MAERDISRLPTFDGNSMLVNVVIETSKGSRTKLKYDEEKGAFVSEKALPVGLVFPFDFGFLPSTIGGDGDPLDVLVLSEDGLPWGTLVLARILGVLKCEQTEKGKTNRNDRLIAEPLNVKSREPMEPRVEFDKRLKKGIEEFFTKYNELQGKKFRSLGFEGAKSGIEIVRQGIRASQRQNHNNKKEK
jgi:inorganic pyrophosphatase